MKRPRKDDNTPRKKPNMKQQERYALVSRSEVPVIDLTTDSPQCRRCKDFYANRDGMCSYCYYQLNGVSIATNPQVIPSNNPIPRISTLIDPYELIKRTRFTLPSPSQLKIIKSLLPSKLPDDMAKLLAGLDEFPPLLIEYKDFLEMIQPPDVSDRMKHVLFAFCFDYWKINIGGPVHCYQFIHGPLKIPPTADLLLDHWYDPDGSLFSYCCADLRFYQGRGCSKCLKYVGGESISLCKCGAMFHFDCFGIQNHLLVCYECSRKLENEYVTGHLVYDPAVVIFDGHMKHDIIRLGNDLDTRIWSVRINLTPTILEDRCFKLASIGFGFK
jgi:hypothetical protein